MVHITHRRLTKPQIKPSWGQNTGALLAVAAVCALVLSAVIFVLKANSPAPLAAVLPGKGSKTVKELFPELGPAELARIKAAAKILDPEIMRHVPASGFSNATKNPCWTDKEGKHRCLPFFYITGLFHAGALSLATKLGKHPEVLTDACTNCQFWGEEGKAMQYYLDNMMSAAQKVKERPDRFMLMDNSPSTFAFYWAAGGKAHRGFQEVVVQCYKNCSEVEAKGGQKIADCMAANCYKTSMEADVQRATKAGIDYDKEAHLPLLMRAVYGDRPPRLIVLVRNPLQRLYSAYHGYPHYHTKYGKNAKGFTAYVKEQVQAFKACEADYGALRCALLFEALSSREEKVYFHCDQLIRGMYSVFLEIWFHFIPPAHWLVINSDDFFTNPHATLDRAMAFLGLPLVPEADLDKMVAADEPKSWVAGQEPMEAEARDILLQFYKPYNNRLAELTGDQRCKTDWNDPEYAHKPGYARLAMNPKRSLRV